MLNAGIEGSRNELEQTSALCKGQCPVGKLCRTEATVDPEDCPRASFCPLGSSVPQSCPKGRYSNTSGLANPSQCTRNAPGHFSAAGSVEQIPCSPGTIAPVGWEMERCQPCAAGRYMNASGGTACSSCAPGHWCTDMVQVPCSKDTWNAQSRSMSRLACEPCPGLPNSTTDEREGQCSISSCLCKAGYYDGAEAAKEVVCLTCPSGTACDKPGHTLGSLPVLPGYFRLDNGSADVRRCPDAKANCSDSYACLTSTSGCRGTIEATMTAGDTGRRRLAESSDTAAREGCRPQLTGVFCRRCVQGTERVYYSPATRDEVAACKPCRARSRTAILIVSGLAVGLAVCGQLGVLLYRRRLHVRLKEQASRAWSAFTPHIKLKVVIGHLQIATRIGKVYGVELPPTVVRLLDVFSALTSLGLSSVQSVLECLGMRRYRSTLATYMLLPIAAALTLLAGKAMHLRYRARLSATALFKTAAPALLKLSFLIYPFVTNMAFDAFSCYHFLQSSWLKADVLVRCGSAEHRDVKALAWVGIIFYAIGLLLLNAALLYHARRAILTRNPTVLSRAIQFLYREFEPHLYWWELVEMLRRLLLVGLMILAGDNMMQLITGLVLSVAFLLVQVQAKPYIHLSDDYLASFASFCLVVIFVCSFAFKYAALLGLQSIQDKMSNEQDEKYLLNESTLTAIIVASCVGALAFSALLFAIQLAVEGKRLQQEERTRKVQAPIALTAGFTPDCCS